MFSRLFCDRWITLGVVRPLVRLGLYRPKPGVPILMYHSICDDPEPGVAPYYRLNTSPARFREQMKWLREDGWQVVPLGEAVRRAGDGRRVAAITFDDGYRDFLTNAWPVLREFSYPVTVFLPTGLIDAGDGFRGKPCLDWDEVRRLAAEGVAFGSHTVTHARLAGLPSDRLTGELLHSKRSLEDHVTTSVEGFSYPYAFPEHDVTFCRSFGRLAQECGYGYVLTTRIGRHRTGDSPWRVRRLPCNGADDRRLLAAKLSGMYDWLSAPQHLTKCLLGSRRHRGEI